MLGSLSLTVLLLAFILFKYIHTRRKLLSWNPYARPAQTTGQPSIYDRWLLIRFAIAVLVLSAYEVVTVLFQASSAASTKDIAAIGTEPDLSASRAMGENLIYVPGVSSGYLVFIVFGTTRPFRQTMYQTFVPKRFQKTKPMRSQSAYASGAVSTHASRIRGGNNGDFSGGGSGGVQVTSTFSMHTQKSDAMRSEEDIELGENGVDQDQHHHYRSRLGQQKEMMADERPILEHTVEIVGKRS